MLEAGMKGRMETVVEDRNTAEAMGSGELKVYATPAVIALAEETAWKSIVSQLEEGQTSVGTRMDLSHIAASPVGIKVWCETELTLVEGRRLEFTLQVFDEAGEIAEGKHERFIVEKEKFLKKTMGKLES